LLLKDITLSHFFTSVNCVAAAADMTHKKLYLVKKNTFLHKDCHILCVCYYIAMIRKSVNKTDYAAENVWVHQMRKFLFVYFNSNKYACFLRNYFLFYELITFLILQLLKHSSNISTKKDWVNV
jgi:hypothetical protein